MAAGEVDEANSGEASSGEASSGEASSIESAIRRLCQAGVYGAAATRAIEAYGNEIRRFIAGRVRNEADARDVFSMFCEDFWQGLPSFGWRCTLRGWAYTIARHSELRHAGSPLRGREGGDTTLAEIDPSARSRTRTPPYARTEVKDRFRRIRGRLSEQDQLILVLRVDRDLQWRDIVQILAGPDVELPAAVIEREGARVRKRFQLIKDRLRQWAAEDGLLSADDADDAVDAS
jgi:RNA polymerase sigma-70 factor (ECF subfamily)